MADEIVYPTWMIENSDGTFTIETKEGQFKMQELQYDKITQLKNRATSGGTKQTGAAMDMFELMLISESLVEPKLAELELKEKKGSVVMRLKAAVYKLYDIESFL